MRIVHVITRLIIGGAQENTLLTVDGLHHQYHDDVTLLTGPAEGPEGDLFDRAAAAEAESRSAARVDPADPALGGPACLPPAPSGLSAAAAGGRAHPQLQGGHPRPGRGLARARSGCRPHDPRHALRAVRDTAQEPALYRARAVGRAAGPRDCQRL